MRSIEWADGDIVVIDQTLLPDRVEYLRLKDVDDVAEAIAALRVRGAPALGIVGAFAVAQAALRESFTVAERAGRQLKATRPTAVNLAWGIDRALDVGRRASRAATHAEVAERMLEEALLIQAEDENACMSMAKHAAEFFTPDTTVMTHCNTGFLCTGGYGTALGAIRYAHENGMGINVLATETRPLLQGARLTAWELGRLGIDHALIVDAAAPGLIARGEVSLVITGADRIASNGDVANKVGTYGLALSAREAGVPFIVVAPISTIDMSAASAADIEVEERSQDEVLRSTITPHGTRARNPAFDLTPAKLVTALVTEQGIARAPYTRSLRALVSNGRLR